MTKAITLSLAAIMFATPVFAFEPIISLEGQHQTIERDGGTDVLLATREQTDGQMGVIILPSKAGQGPGPAIVQALGSETWYVLDGTFEFHVGDKIFNGGSGTFISVDAGQPHGYIAKSDGHILVVYTPGGYEHFFEDWAKKGLSPGPELGQLENSYGVTRP
ncbi:MAG: hypothetical protein JWQ65_3103 [Devosia sp.]|nr:hypothetical protein [Devosia sp.]